MVPTVLAATALIVLVSACGTDPGPRDDAGGGTDPSRSTSPPTSEGTAGDDPLATARADLAADTGVDADEVEVVIHEQVTWRNGSLGCPQSGTMYTQALVEGYRIVLRVAGREVAYHGQQGKPPFRCDDPDPDGTTSPDR